jgi:competence protein ComEC
MRVKSALLIICLAFPVAAVAELRLLVLDVGEGQSILLVRESHGLLIDTGHAGQSPSVLAAIQAEGVRSVDQIVLTHLHPDHASGYFRLREAYPKAVVIESGHRVPALAAPDMTRWVAEALDREPANLKRVLRSGDRWLWRDIELSILWPENPAGINLNRHSLVIELSFGKVSALIMGDADKMVEAELLKRGVVPANVDLLMVGHHAAADSSSERFLDLVRPQIAAVSVNAGNVRGYPSAATLKRVQRYSRKVHRTDQDGSLCLEWRREKREPQECK